MKHSFHGSGSGYIGYFQKKEAPGKYDPQKHDTWMASVFAHVSGRLPGQDSWRGLPLVIRLGLRSTQGQASRVASWPVVLFGKATRGSSRGSESFVLLDLTGMDATMTIVLRDWSELILEHDALDAFGFSATELQGALYAGGRRTRPGDVADGPTGTWRWEVASEHGALVVRTGNLSRDDVEPCVGRIALGELTHRFGGKAESIRTEVLCLPRLTTTRTRRVDPSECVMSVDGQEDAWRAMLTRTYLSQGAGQTLLALLELAHGGDFHRVLGRVELRATDDVSPLALLPLLDALEAAAAARRRLYQRRGRTLRAPGGTLRVSAYMNNLARQRPDLVPVDRFDLTTDTPENRLFRGSADRARRVLAKQPGALAAMMRRGFERVEAGFPSCQLVPPTSVLAARVLSGGALPKAQEDAARLCLAMLEQRYPGLELLGEDFASMRGFELNIADLFEAAARAALGRCIEGLGMRVEDGNVTASGSGSASQQHLYWSEPADDESLRELGLNPGKKTHVSLLPDFIVRKGEAVVAVGDAKYKRPERRGGSNSSHAPLRREDLHQLVTYMAAYPRVKWGVVMFPRSSSADRTSGTGSTRLLSELLVGTDRRIGVFDFDASEWRDEKVNREALTGWLRERRT